MEGVGKGRRCTSPAARDGTTTMDLRRCCGRVCRASEQSADELWAWGGQLTVSGTEGEDGKGLGGVLEAGFGGGAAMKAGLPVGSGVAVGGGAPLFSLLPLITCKTTKRVCLPDFF